MMTLPNGAQCKAAAFALCAAVVCACATASSPSPSPGRPTNTREVTIYRDDWGVPHIYAQSEAAAFYGLGYAEAEDRPARTMFLFLFARGEVSRAEGARTLQLDMRNRLWRHRDMGARGVSRLSPELRRNYEAYLRGLHDYYSEHPDQRPPYYFEPDLADILAVERAAFFFGYQSAQAMADCGAPSPVPAPPTSNTPGTASNGWAVMPSRTSGGAVIVGSDPHVANSSAFYYEYRIDAGSLKSSGYAMGPFLWQAHNRDVAWSMTTGGPDIVDCYEVDVDPHNPSRYLYDGSWRQFITYNERFEVRGGEAVERRFEYTMHNGVLSPVIDRHNGKAYVASAVAMDHSGRFGAEILAMNRARNLQEIRSAMSNLGMFQQNVIVGDRSGHIMYVRAGATAVRPTGYDWTRPVPGNTSQTAWRGLHPFADLVQIVDPRAGYLQNNNVSPDMVNLDRPVSASDYPAEVFNDRPGRINSRGVRANQVLSSNAHMSMEDAIGLAMDETWVSAPDWLAALDYGAQQHPDFVARRSAAFRTVLERLRSFDGVASSHSTAAAAFLLWRHECADLLTAREFVQFRQWPWDRSTFTPAFGFALLQRLDAVVSRMQHDYGNIDVTLGQMFFAGRAVPGWPIGGLSIELADQCDSPAVCDQPMRAFAARLPGSDGPQPILSGSQAMRLVTFTDPIQSFSLYAFGQSDDPNSAHFSDQARLFSERRMKPTYFDFSELQSHIESQRTLTFPADISQ